MNCDVERTETDDEHERGAQLPSGSEMSSNNDLVNNNCTTATADGGDTSSASSYRAQYPLHYAVFKNNVKLLSKVVKEKDANIDQQDMHGNTALHLAVMLGHKESTAMLLAHNASVKIKNCFGWNPLMEAISYGDRQIIVSLMRKLKSQSRDVISSHKQHLLDVLNGMKDFYLELKWDFQSWLPLVSRILPSDVCKIYKRGTTIRFDTTLVDFNERTWQRGDISFIFDAAAEDSNKRLIVLDNHAKVFQRVLYQESEAELDEEVDVLMSSDIVNVQMSTKPIAFHRCVTGWFFRHDKSEIVGEYNADFYHVEGLRLVTRKRREHLSADDIKKNKALLQNFQMGQLNEDDFLNRNNNNHRASLVPPPQPHLTFDAYCDAPKGQPPVLGRTPQLKNNSKLFKATVAMSTEFPFSIDALLDILEVVAPFKHVDKLRKFCELKMPPGFPVRLEIPLFPTISAKVTFQELRFTDDFPQRMFKIPSSYKEDPTRFPDL